MRLKGRSLWPRVVVALIGAVAIVAGPAVIVTFAQVPAPPSQPPSPVPEIAGQAVFGWAFKAGGVGANWPEGGMYALLGMIGAAVSIYLFAGDLLPSMGGKARLAIKQAEADSLKATRKQALDHAMRELDQDNPHMDKVSSWQSVVGSCSTEIARIEAEVGSERRGLLLTATPLYAVLGAFFATLIATNVLQALVIGFAWTAAADRLGLKREQETRKEEREKLEATLQGRIAEKSKQNLELQSAALVALDERDRARRAMRELLQERERRSGGQ